MRYIFYLAIFVSINCFAQEKVSLKFLAPIIRCDKSAYNLDNTQTCLYPFLKKEVIIKLEPQDNILVHKMGYYSEENIFDSAKYKTFIVLTQVGQSQWDLIGRIYKLDSTGKTLLLTVASTNQKELKFNYIVSKGAPLFKENFVYLPFLNIDDVKYISGQ